MLSARVDEEVFAVLLAIGLCLLAGVLCWLMWSAGLWTLTGGLVTHHKG